jgi:hypothetical protein
LIHFEWEKPSEGGLVQWEQASTTLCLRASTKSKYFAETQDKEVEKRAREEPQQDTRDRKKQKLYDFWK